MTKKEFLKKLKVLDIKDKDQKKKVIRRHFFECEKGNRWSEPEWDDPSMNSLTMDSKDGDICGFSGCERNDHKIKLVKSLDNDDPAGNDWFRSVHDIPGKIVYHINSGQVKKAVSLLQKV